MTSALRSDLARYGAAGLLSTLRVLARHQQAWALVDYRFGRWSRERGLMPLISLSAILHRIVEMTTGISISPRAQIGPGMLISHFGGIVIGPGVEIGARCSLSHGVTIGQASADDERTPVIGDGVSIAPGAKVFGAITVGSQATIGANAVVNRDVPAGAVAVGVPARVVGEGDERTA
jgi:serine O-acetyltransferase